MPQELPSLDLVVATTGRVAELERLLDSFERQSHPRFTVFVVDQNEDSRLRPVLAAHPGLHIAHVRSQPGLSRARNAALGELAADLVAFPDDDCIYPPDLLERVASRFARDSSLEGLTGRVAAADGRSSESWKRDPALLTAGNLWNRAASGAMFLRRELVAALGAFDERLGLGSSEPWSSGEEIDYLIRAVKRGAQVAFDPDLVVEHEVSEDTAEIRLRDGATVGYLLRKHRYPPRTVARMLLRPAGGALLAFARRDLGRARLHAATLEGRVLGLRSKRTG